MNSMVLKLEGVFGQARTAMLPRQVSCGGCGNVYDFAQRRADTRDKAKPNTAHKYCSDPCWAVETSTIEAC